MRYTAETVYTEKLLRRLFTVTNMVFYKKRTALFYVAAALLIAAACFLNIPKALRLFLLLIGAWCIVGRELPAIIRAADTVEQRKGRLPVYRLDFKEQGIYLAGEGKMRLEYQSLSRLVEDAGNFYLFQTKDRALVVERSRLCPGEPEKFKAFLTEKTGRSFESSRSILTLTLWDLLKPAPKGASKEDKV